MQINNENLQKMNFKDYFESLDTDAKNAIRDAMAPLHMGYTTFYEKLRNESWKVLELRELERLTNQTFER